jgi:hypothetical protein
MTTDTEKASDEEVFQDLEAALADFPRLKAMLPPTYPRAKRFKISRDAMESYAATRGKRFWHNLNLPLLLHNYRNNPDGRARSFFQSLLKTLDDFADGLGNLPGARSLMSPLWDDPWNPMPQFWSIVGCAYVALCYQRDGIDLVGFESQISGTLKDDITVRIKGKITHVEVEAHHLADFDGQTDDQVLVTLESRAEVKAGKKFAEMPEDRVGLVAVVCVLTGADVERQIRSPIKVLPGRGPNVGWTAWMLAGVVHPDGPRFALLWL